MEKVQDKISKPTLKDVSKSGKDRHWRERKISNRQLAKQLYNCWVMKMRELGYDEDDLPPYDPEDPDCWLFKKSIKATGCADVLTFLKSNDGSLKLYQAWFCKDRLCPICNWRRAMKFSTQVGLILNEFKRRKVKGRPIFATFTMRNVKADEISESFSKFARSFTKLRQYKEVAKSLVGAIRASEITYNPDSDEIEYMDNVVFVKNGMAEFQIKHCSDYFLTAAVVNDAVNNPQSVNYIIIGLIVVVFILIAITLKQSKK